MRVRHIARIFACLRHTCGAGCIFTRALARMESYDNSASTVRKNDKDSLSNAKCACVRGLRVKRPHNKEQVADMLISARAEPQTKSVLIPPIRTLNEGTSHTLTDICTENHCRCDPMQTRSTPQTASYFDALAMRAWGL